MHKSSQTRIVTFLLAVAPALLTSANTERRVAAAEFTAVSLGHQRMAQVGAWMPVEVTAEGLDPATEVDLVVTASDPRGNRVVMTCRSGRSDVQGRVSLAGLCRVGRIDAPVDVAIRTADGVPACRRVIRCVEGLLPEESPAVQSFLKLYRHDLPFVLSVGETAGLPELLDRAAAVSADQPALLGLTLPSAEQLPADSRGYDTVSTIILNGDVPMTDAQFAAIRSWVCAGGHLILSCSDSVAGLLATPLGRWLKDRFGIEPETRIVTDFDLAALQSFVPRSTRITTFRRTVRRAQISQGDAVALAESRSGPMIARIGIGGGTVTFLPVNLNERPLSQWRSLPDLYAMLVLGEPVTRATDRALTARISSTGVSDLTTQLMASVDARPATGRWSTWSVMALAFAWLLLIGPFDYALVVLLFRRPQLTWITFPLWVAGGFAILVWLKRDPEPTPVLNSVHVVDVADDVAGHCLQTLSYLSLSMPETGRVNLEARAAEDLGPLDGGVELSWSGRPEGVYGGLYRTGGIGLGQTTYAWNANQPDLLRGVPAMVDGSFEMQSRWSGSSATPLLESSLQVSGFGLLEGHFAHHLPRPLRDWLIIHGNRVYRSRGEDRAALPPGQYWESRQGAARIMDLKTYLSGRRPAREAPVSGPAADSGGQVPWNARGRDPLDILTIMSLYEVAGADAYTGLSHHSLGRMELSESIRMNYALVIGWIDEPATELTIDGDPVVPAESTTIVRLLLPVNRRPSQGRALTDAELQELEQSEDVSPEDAVDDSGYPDPSASEPSRD